MNEKAMLKKKIHEYDFALHELNLFLDSHPTNEKAFGLLREYRKMREALVNQYVEKFGNYVNTVDDAKAEGCFQWLKGPWPWENGFMEG